MSTFLITSLHTKSWLRPKRFLWGILGLMLAYVLYHDESFLVHPKDPLWQHYEPFKWWLLPHGIAGACALLLGPMQFSDRLRECFRQLHRVVGRIYVTGVFVAAPLGFYIQYFQERMGDPRSFSIAGAVDAAFPWGNPAPQSAQNERLFLMMCRPLSISLKESAAPGRFPRSSFPGRA